MFFAFTARSCVPTPAGQASSGNNAGPDDTIFLIIPLESVGHDTFAPLFGGSFITDPSLELRLETVQKLAERRGGMQRDPFAITLGALPLLFRRRR